MGSIHALPLKQIIFKVRVLVKSSTDARRQCMSCQQSDTHVFRTELWDHLGSNIAAREKSRYGEKLFRRPKTPFW